MVVRAKDGRRYVSNLGAPEFDKPYFVTISDRGSRRLIQLESAVRAASETRGVEQCI